LSQRNKIKRTTIHEVNLQDSELVIDIQAFGTQHKIIYLKQNKYFKHSYARLGCFLTSAVRREMANIIYPHRDRVYRCHTDSILSDIELPLLIGSNLGDFKLEKSGYAYIQNSNSVIWKKTV
jgi:hypothetical protein